MFFRFSIFILVFIACKPDKICPEFVSSSEHLSVWHDTAFTTYLDRHIQQFMQSSGCPGITVVAVQDQQILLNKSYGLRSTLAADSIDNLTLFRLGSVSKGFTGMLASILVEKGFFSLDDAVTDYLPECRIRAKNKDGILRVGHLLSQSTGFTEHAYSNLVDMNHPREVLYDYIMNLQPRDSTGIDYAYQNVAFGLIEGIIEKSTGLMFEQAMDQYLFSPLGMCHSSCTYHAYLSSPNRCTGHTGRAPGTFAATQVKPNYYNLPSAGGINANGQDMIIWLRALLGAYPEVMNPNAVKLAFTPYVNTGRDDRFFNVWPEVTESHYGLGWRIIKTPHRTIAYHGGLVNHFRTEIAIDQQNHTGVVFLFNSVCDYADEAVFRFFQEWDCYQTQKLTR
jgi:beta-lactamase class C